MREFLQRHQQLVMVIAGVIVVLGAAAIVGAFLGAL